MRAPLSSRSLPSTIAGQALRRLSSAALVLAPLALAACGSTSQVATANGTAYRVECGGLFGSKLDCNTKASQMCPAGFDPIESPPGHLVFTCSRRPVPATAPI